MENYRMITLFEKIRVSWIPELFALITQGFLLWKIAPLQVDPHHDGIILGAAIATSDGRYGNLLTLYREFRNCSSIFHGTPMSSYRDTYLLSYS
jgi:hypothetical protein